MIRPLVVALAISCAVVGTPLGADTIPLPDEQVTDESRKQFRICRAAILIELRADEDKRTPIRPSVIEAMREQIDFVMSETIFNVPSLSLKDGERRLAFAERFVLDFGRTISAEMEHLDDPSERGPVLLGCQTLIWQIVKERIEVLIQWRRRALGLDAPFPMKHAQPPQ